MVFSCGKLSLGSGDKDHDTHKDAVVVTTPAMGKLTQEIAPEGMEVFTLLTNEANPETFEPSMKTLADVEDASIFLTLNTPGFESNFSRQIKSNNPDLMIADVSKQLPAITGTHEGGAADPHYFSSLRNVIQLNTEISKVLAQRYPAMAHKIDSLATLNDSRLRTLDDEVKETLRKSYGRSFVVFHPIMTYFCRDYGLRQFTLEDHGKELTPKELSNRMMQAKIGVPTVLFYDSATDPDRAKQTAKDMGIEAVAVNFNGPDYEQDILKAAKAIAKANEKPIIYQPPHEGESK